VNPDELTCKEAVELVTDYLESALLPEMVAQFEDHLDTCPGCTAYLQQMQQTVNLLRRFANDTTPVEMKQELLQVFRGLQNELTKPPSPEE